MGMSRAGESRRVHSFRLFPKASGTEQRASTQPASRLALGLGREAACDFPEPELENSAWPGPSLIPSSPPLVLIPSGCGVTSPRFELPMGTTEQPPLPQQTQPPTKVPCPGPSGACPGTQSATHPTGDMCKAGEEVGQEGSHPEFQQKTLHASPSRGGGLSARAECSLGFSSLLAWRVAVRRPPGSQSGGQHGRYGSAALASGSSPSLYKQGNKVLEGGPHLRSHSRAGAPAS